METRFRIEQCPGGWCVVDMLEPWRAIGVFARSEAESIAHAANQMVRR